MLVLAIANGTLREAIFIPVLGKLPGLVLSGTLLSGAIVAITYFALPWIKRVSIARYLIIGFSWLCLTLVFEFTFGRLILGEPWSQILEAYTFKDGNIWSLILLITAISPYVAAKLRGWV